MTISILKCGSILTSGMNFHAAISYRISYSVRLSDDVRTDIPTIILCGIRYICSIVSRWFCQEKEDVSGYFLSDNFLLVEFSEK